VRQLGVVHLLCVSVLVDLVSVVPSRQLLEVQQQILVLLTFALVWVLGAPRAVPIILQLLLQPLTLGVARFISRPEPLLLIPQAALYFPRAPLTRLAVATYT